MLMDLPHHASGERDYIAMRTLTVVRQYLAAAFLLVIGVIAYGCGDSATVNPVVELASLTVDPGTLQPAFSGGTTQYTVDISNNITSATITAQPAVAGDSVTINGQATTSSVIPLGAAGITTPVNIVVSETGTNSRTYTVLFVRAGLTGNNSLQDLSVSPGTLDSEFTANDLNYSVDVANTVGSIRVTPTLSDPAATMTVNGQATNSGQARTVTLNPAGQPTNIPIVVTAQNGTPKTYQVTVSRGVSGNNNLQGLTVSPGTLDRAFLASRTGYTVNVASTVVNITVTPRVQDPAATMTVNGQGTNSGQARTIQLGAEGSNTPIIITVTAQNGTQKTYTVGINRAARNGNNNLRILTVSPGTLTPSFDEGLLTYTVDVANNVGTINVTPTPDDSTATMTVNGQAIGSGQSRTVSLNPAGQDTNVPIVVTAQNGNAKSYLITVSRGVSSNNTLQSLTVSPGTLNPTFSANRTSYTVNVASTVTSVTVTPRVQDGTASMTVNGQPSTSGQAQTIQLGPAGSNTSVIIIVTAQNGTQRTYTVGINRAALGGNNNLSALTVSPGSLDATFNANDLSYTVEVGSSVSSITVTPTRQDPNATITVNGTPATSGQGRSITLNGAGLNTLINIVVTAPNSSQKPYAVTVERAALGGNNNLSALTVSPGTLSPPFSATRTRTDYAVNNVGSSDTNITVTATPQDSSASVTINGQGGSSRSISLPTGPSQTEIDVRVIAPNSNDKTYSITVNQPAPASPPAPTSAPDLIPEDDSCEPGIPDPAVCAPGTSKDDNVTNVTAPSFTVAQPAAGETPTLYVDGSIAKQGFDSGANTLTPTAALSDGVHTITSTVTNAGGLESPQSASLTVTIDTVAPGP
ncbi:MAG: cadherin-like beta sandwich domain-containing protein [Nitrospira sp.]|nr:MAG: cadherin-like beta sandwich domain-containing protein [Nitrospira sp.]